MQASKQAINCTFNNNIKRNNCLKCLANENFLKL